MLEPKEASSAVPACSASILHWEHPWEKQSVIPKKKIIATVNNLNLMALIVITNLQNIQTNSK